MLPDLRRLGIYKGGNIGNISGPDSSSNWKEKSLRSQLFILKDKLRKYMIKRHLYNCIYVEVLIQI